jgi:tetratricopeptide (TPR) repeat protein
MKVRKLSELCAAGEQADALLSEGKAREALKEYQKLVRDLETNRDIDSYLIAKATLGTLRCYVKLGDFKSAYSVWNAAIDEGVYGIGIYALENAQTTVHDLLIYDMLCAFLHTLGDVEKKEAARAVNQYLSRVCEQAIEDGDRVTLRMAVNNWKHHLKSIFGGPIPLDSTRSLIHFEKTIGDTVKPQPIEFPKPSPWEKPEDFREMSHLAIVPGQGTSYPETSDRSKRRRQAS